MEIGQLPLFELDSLQHKLALTILRRELDYNSPPPWQKRVFKILMGLLYLLGLSAGFVLALWALGASLGMDKLAGFEYTFLVINGVLFVVLFVLFAATFILSIVAIPYLYKVLRQYKLAKNLGVTQTLIGTWRTATSRRKRIQDMVFLILPLLFLLPIAVFLATDSYWWFVPVPVIIGVSIIILFIARRSEQRLALVFELQSSLAMSEATDADVDDQQIPISPDAYQMVAEIERDQITRDRMQTILANNMGDEVSPYGVWISQAARSTLSGLPGSTRLRVQDALDELSLDPDGAGTTETADQDLTYLDVEDTPVKIVFSVDDGVRRIKVVGIDIEDEAEANRQPLVEE